jgi:hypothetical protein
MSPSLLHHLVISARGEGGAIHKAMRTQLHKIPHIALPGIALSRTRAPTASTYWATFASVQELRVGHLQDQQD